MSRQGPDSAWNWDPPRLTVGGSLDGLPGRPLVRWDGGPTTAPTMAVVAVVGDRLAVSFRTLFPSRNDNPSLPRDRGCWRLWERDVVEVFIAASPEGVPYRELEASPAGQWLALAFDDYRRPAPGPWHPTVGVRVRNVARHCQIDLTIPLAALAFPDSPRPSAWRIGLFQIHRGSSGRQHLGLLAGGATTPDFHRPESWVPLAPLV